MRRGSRSSAGRLGLARRGEAEAALRVMAVARGRGKMAAWPRLAAARGSGDR